MIEGRRRASERRRKEAEKRVEEYRKWLREDAKYYAAKAAGVEVPPKPVMPIIPSDADFALARGDE